MMPEQNYIEELREVWDMVKESFREPPLKLSETAINLWFGEIEILSYENDRISLGIPTEGKFNIITDKFLDAIQASFSRFFGFDIQVDLRFTGSAKSAGAPFDQSKNEAVKKASSSDDQPSAAEGEFAGMPDYNFEYTFENFVVGSTNKFAHAACVSVANHPATNYNPLFIYGNSGLGKTHLMSAIINRMKENNPNVNIIYTKGEDFTNQMIASLTNNTMQDFRDKFRNCDALLIDDIQFIAGKISTQEEFFHTFNELFEHKKQIILTSDRPPRDIQHLEDRLKSRFEWGLLADIEPPDLELRIAIIKKKAEQVNVNIPADVLTYLAENLRSNIRQIEGAIKKLGALNFLSGQSITMEVAKNCILELLGGAEPVSTTVDKIFSSVYNRYHISKEELTGKKRTKEIATVRHTTIYLIRELTEMSYPNISKLFDRDHTTIMASMNIINRRLATEPDYQLEHADLRREIRGH